MAKEMWYEERQSVCLSILHKVQEMGAVFTEDEYDELLEFMEEQLDEYSEGDWRNYN